MAFYNKNRSPKRSYSLLFFLWNLRVDVDVYWMLCWQKLQRKRVFLNICDLWVLNENFVLTFTLLGNIGWQAHMAK